MAVQFDADGQRILTSTGDDTARLWDLDTGDELARYDGHCRNITDIAFLPEAAGIVTTGTDHLLCFYALPEAG